MKMNIKGVRIKNKKDKRKDIEYDINNMEKDITVLKKFYESCDYKEVIKRYQNIQQTLIALVGIVLAIVAIPTTISWFTYSDKINELNRMISAEKYILSAVESDSFEDKLEQYTLAIEYDKENPNLYYRRAEMYFGLKNYEKAIEDCKKVLQYEPERNSAILLCAKSYYFLRNYELALNYFLQVNVEDNNGSVNAYIAFTYYYLSDYETALSYFNKINAGYAMHINENDNFYSCKISSYLHLNKIDEAIDSLAEYVHSNFMRTPNDIIIAAESLINIYEKQNNIELKNEISDGLNALRQEKIDKEELIKSKPDDESKILSNDDALFNLILPHLYRLQDERQ